MNILSCLRPLLFWLGALIFSGAAAQDSSAPQYDVELIVFRNLGSKSTPENWAAEEARFNRGKSSSEDNVDSQTRAAPGDGSDLQSLPVEQLKLGALAASLRGNRNYRVLSHLAWTQSAVSLRSDAVTVLTPLFGADSLLDGSAKLSRGTTLHLSLDLRLRNESGPSYVLQESRQIKLGEKHYYDHPHFGVIATVTAHR